MVWLWLCIACECGFGCGCGCAGWPRLVLWLRFVLWLWLGGVVLVRLVVLCADKITSCIGRVQLISLLIEFLVLVGYSGGCG